jgi:tetratricopeptide (TPR) repeat protein
MIRRSRFLILFFFMIQMIGCISTPALRPRVSPPSVTPGQTEFKTAAQAYERGDYSQAIRTLMDIIQRYPGAPILSETQWMLAKSYEAQGNHRLALEEYQRFMKNYPDSEHFYEAKLRSDVLVGALAMPSPQGPEERVRAVQFTLGRFTDPMAFESTIQMLSRNGMNTLIIPMIRPPDPLPGVFFKTDAAPVIQDRLGSVLMVAHRYGMRVFASMPLRHLAWLTDTNWMDLQFDPANRRFEPVRRLNLWNPRAQDYLLSLYLDLAAYPLDGLIIEEPVGYSETEGFNENALKQFNKDFGLSVTPSDLYGNNPMTPAFWRWTGWKNRQVTAVLRHLVHELHLERPQLRIGLAMSKEAVGQPTKALVKYGQDLLEAKDAGFDFFVFTWPPGSLQTGDLSGTVRRLKELLSDPGKILLRIELPSQKVAGGVADELVEIDPKDLKEIEGISLAFVRVRDSFDWVRKLPSALLPARPFP